MWGKKRKWKKLGMLVASMPLLRLLPRSWRKVDERNIQLRQRHISEKGVKSLEVLAIELASITPRSADSWHSYLTSCVLHAMNRARLDWGG
jgi:hypothetical protein